MTERFSVDVLPDLDYEQVALFIIGRSKHPFNQFLGDILSGGFDADKLDYLQRDAKAGGLPLAFDIERYLYFVRIEAANLGDGDGALRTLYDVMGSHPPERHPADASSPFPFYRGYQLRLPRRAMTAIEQIVISKLMLFSYIYHHPKIRSAEGLLERFLSHTVENWKRDGKSDGQIMAEMLATTDSDLHSQGRRSESDPVLKLYSGRLATRVLPREIYRLSPSAASPAAAELLGDYLRKLRDTVAGEKTRRTLEEAIGRKLLLAHADPNSQHQKDVSGAANWQEALMKAGTWVDVPKAPKFEGIDELVPEPGRPNSGVPIASMFPIHRWTDAYVAYAYLVRIYAFSEYSDVVANASARALEETTRIPASEFYENLRRTRSAGN